MLDATPDCIKLLSTDGRVLSMNRAGCLALDVPEDSDFGMPWLPLLSQSVRQVGAEALRAAALGHNARFPGQSQSSDEIKYWDNLLTPITDETGAVQSILCVSRDVTVKTTLEKELEAVINREKLLSREMQHRIKNLFAVVSALITISEKEANGSGGAGAPTKILREKVAALSRASDVAFSSPDLDGSSTKNSQFDISSLIASVMKPYGDHVQRVGEPAFISYQSLTTIALFLHELATNSIKYGALSADDGRVTLLWTQDDQDLGLTWSESGGPPVTAASHTRQGFGTEMVDQIVRSAGGRVERTWPENGLITKLHLPNSASH
jgi:two-component sensor histidine kinase